MKTIKVVGAVIEKENGEILCALRSPSMSMPNLWEFPGGKVKEGEKPEAALVREIREELGCIITVGNLIADVVHQYPDITVILLTFEARIVAGVPKALEHAKLSWVKREDLTSLQWAPADIPTVERLIKQ